MNYTLEVNEEDISVIGTALDEMPFKTVSVLVDKLRSQIVNQQKPVEPVVQTTAAKTKTRKG